MSVELSDIMQGLGLLGGVLSLPRTAQYGQEDVMRHRQMLQGTGMSDADINAMYPDAPLQWL